MVETTHRVRLDDEGVLKTYRCSYGDEHLREWKALRLLHRYAPGLAPEPRRLATTAGAPAISMSRVRGEPLGGTPLTDRQVEALGVALHRLHSSLPAAELSRLPKRRWGPEALTGALGSWLDRPHAKVPAHVEAALAEAARWVDGSEPTATMEPNGDAALAHGDGNLGNVIWDGDRCSIIDFEDSGHGDPAYEIADLTEHGPSRCADCSTRIGCCERSGSHRRSADATRHTGERSRRTGCSCCYPEIRHITAMPQEASTSRPGTSSDC